MQAVHAFGLTRPELKLLLWIPIPLLATWLFSRGTDLMDDLGLKPPLVSSFAAAALAFAVAYAIFVAFRFTPEMPPHKTIFGMVVVAGITEELLFRGFALTQLLRAGLTAPQALGITSLLFGLAHAPVVWASGDPLALFLEVAITGIAGLVLGIVMLLMNGSVFAPMALHMSINFVWEVFAVAPNAIGGPEGIVARVAAALVALAMALGWHYAHRRRHKA
jgi:membrane protease YdiL (CAAX protease family)